MKEIATTDLIVIAKPRGGLHPPQVELAYPVRKFWPNKLGNTATYDDLNDDTPMREYAWAFLRRNRFFQQQQDRAAKSERPFYSEEQWGFQIARDYPRTSGLNSSTKYWQKYQYWRNRNGQHEDRMEWDLASYLKSENLHTALGPMSRKVAVEPGQIAIVFDSRVTLGLAMTIDLQLGIAREHLRNLIEQQATKTQSEPQPKNAHKGNLRNLLRIADLFSERTWVDLSEVAQKFMDFEKGVANARKLPYDRTRKSAENRASRLAAAAFSYIYAGEFQKLLVLDPWPWNKS